MMIMERRKVDHYGLRSATMKNSADVVRGEMKEILECIYPKAPGRYIAETS